RQGAFTFWNHPYWTDQTPDGVARLTPVHRKLVEEGLLQGIEVANMADVSPEAFRIAEQEGLTILGTSDVHGLLDWEAGLTEGGHRTATLVLARERSTPALRDALMRGDTVAVYNDTYIGLRRNVEPVIRNVLRIEAAAHDPETTLLPVTLHNAGALHLTLQEIGPEGFYDEGPVLRIPAGGSVVVRVRDVADPSTLTLRFRVLSSMVGPDEMLELDFGPELPGTAARSKSGELGPS
ncbi:MAG: Sb-PDE family phosphodiesterase, partial [Gammaproteobacteria bacterium]